MLNQGTARIQRLLTRHLRAPLRNWLGRDRCRLHPELNAVNFSSGVPIILDVGANRGGFATDILLRAPCAEIHCFEPNPEMKKLLERKACLDRDRRIRVVGAALGESPGSMELKVTAFHQASSFLAVSDGSRESWPGADFSVSRCVQVPVLRLDDYARENDLTGARLLKIDTQGFELEVLRGAGAFLSRIDYVLAEISFVELYEGAPLWGDVVSFMDAAGFRLISVGGICLSAATRQPVCADALFSRVGLIK